MSGFSPIKTSQNLQGVPGQLQSDDEAKSLQYNVFGQGELTKQNWIATGGLSVNWVSYGLSFLLAWIISYNLAFFLGSPDTTWQWGVAAGLLAGVGWVVTQFVVIALFEQRSWKYMVINCGYVTVYFAMIGFILGIWR